MSDDRASGCDSDFSVWRIIRLLGYDGSVLQNLRHRSCHSLVRRSCIRAVGTNRTSSAAYRLRYYGVFAIEDAPIGVATCSLLHYLRDNFLIRLGDLVSGTCAIIRVDGSLLRDIWRFVRAYLPASEQISESLDAGFRKRRPGEVASLGG